MKMCSFEVWLLSSVAVPSTKTFLAVAAKVSREPSKKRDERGSDEEVCLIRLRCWDVLNKMCRGRLQGIHMIGDYLMGGRAGLTTPRVPQENEEIAVHKT
jgi:hypothetical protein